MEGSLAILGFWIFMIVLVLKKPITQLIEKSKDVGASNNEILQRLKQLESHALLMTKELTSIREILLTQSTDAQLIQLKSDLNLEEIEGAKLLEEGKTDYAQSAAQDEGKDDYVEPAADHDVLNALGTIQDASTIRIERVLPGRAKDVWKYFSDQKYISEWLGNATLQPRVGGRIELHFEDEQRIEGVARVRGLINTCEPPREIAFSWIDTEYASRSSVSFKLSEDEHDTKIVLVHSALPEDKLAQFLAMWHARFDLLIARLRNLVPPDFIPTYQKLLPIYAAMALTASAAAAPASAAVSDESYHTIVTQRSHLLAKYDTHWHDADELEKQIVQLKRENTSDAERTIDQLDRKLKDQYRDLHEIELDIKALDKAIL